METRMGEARGKMYFNHGHVRCLYFVSLQISKQANNAVLSRLHLVVRVIYEFRSFEFVHFVRSSSVFFIDYNPVLGEKSLLTV